MRRSRDSLWSHTSKLAHFTRHPFATYPTHGDSRPTTSSALHVFVATMSIVDIIFKNYSFKVTTISQVQRHNSKLSYAYAGTSDTNTYSMLHWCICCSCAPWWRNQMEPFPRYWPLVRVTGGFPSQRPMTRKFDVCYDVRLNNGLSKQSRCRWFETPWRSWWRHRYDE